MIGEWDSAVESARAEAGKATETAELKGAVFAKLKPDPSGYCRRFLAFAEANPQDGPSRDALLWIIMRATAPERTVDLPGSLRKGAGI